MNKKFCFTTSAGVIVEFTPPSATILEMGEAGIREEFKEKGEQMELPTYKREIYGSKPDAPLYQTFPMDEKYIETAPDEEKVQWEAYKDCQARFQLEVNKLRKQVCLEALHIQLPEDNSWIKSQLNKHIRVPGITSVNGGAIEIADHQILLFHYIETEILRTLDDIYASMGLVLASAYTGTVDEASIEAASKTFRNRIQEAALQASSTTGNPDQINAGEGNRQLAAQ